MVPLRKLDDTHVLELFHGPTLAFKDIALQFLGNVFNYVLEKRGSSMNIIGSTSGDTGSAAIAGVRGKNAISIFVMYPDGRTSRLQELQMTSVLDPNVHCIAIQGSFDECQAIMKEIFNDLPFKAHHRLGAVNSVNWARLHGADRLLRVRNARARRRRPQASFVQRSDRELRRHLRRLSRAEDGTCRSIG